MKRVKWKGIFVKPNNYKKTSLTSFTSRRTSIVPELIGKTVKIYNGKKTKKLKITQEMLNHKLGEFFKTRTEFEFKKKKKKKR